MAIWVHALSPDDFFVWFKRILTVDEAFVWRCSVKEVFIKISQNSWENTCMGACKPATLSKKENPINLFSCEFCEIFKNIFFTEPLRTAASVPTGSIFVSWKNSLLFFHQSWNLPLLNYSEVDVIIPLVLKHKFFSRDMRLFEMLVFIIRIICILSNIWLMFSCLKRFILIVNGWLLISYDRV